MALLPCVQWQAFVLGCYLYLDPGSFSLISLFKIPVSWCVSHLCMTWLWGSSVTTAVNLLLHANVAACLVLLPWGVMVSKHVRQLLLAAWINTINTTGVLWESWKQPLWVPALQVHLFCFSFYKGITGGSQGVCVCPVLMNTGVHWRFWSHP